MHVLIQWEEFSQTLEVAAKWAWTFIRCNQGLFFEEHVCFSLHNILHNTSFSLWYSFGVLVVLMECLFEFELEVLNIVQDEFESTARAL